MGEHIVEAGECMASIAEKHKFFRWESIYYHESNAELRKTRPNPDQLKVGDKVTIPELEDREELCQTGQEHVFQLRAKPTTEIFVQLEVDGELLANKRFELNYTVEGSEVLRKGYTTPEGEVEGLVPVAVKAATLKVWPSEDTNTPPHSWDLKIGDLDPVTEDSGVQDRLRNLGFHVGDEDGEIGEKTRAAIKSFQLSAGLEATGTLDDRTRKALEAQADG